MQMPKKRIPRRTRIDVHLTLSMVPGSRSTRIARGTNLPPSKLEHLIWKFTSVRSFIFSDAMSHLKPASLHVPLTLEKAPLPRCSTPDNYNDDNAPDNHPNY